MKVITEIFLTCTVLFLLVMFFLWRTSSSTEEFLFVWVQPLTYAMITVIVPIVFIIVAATLHHFMEKRKTRRIFEKNQKEREKREAEMEAIYERYKTTRQ